METNTTKASSFVCGPMILKVARLHREGAVSDYGCALLCLGVSTVFPSHISGHCKTFRKTCCQKKKDTRSINNDLPDSEPQKLMRPGN